jgi:hypothetical protein
MTTPERPENQARNSQTLDAALAAVRAGNTNQALGIIAGVIRQQPANEKAWLLLASLLEDPDRKRECLNRVLAINPNNNEAQVELLLLETASVAVPPQPPSPPVFASPPTPTPPSSEADVSGAPKRRMSDRAFWLAVAAIVACMFVFGVGMLVAIRNAGPELGDSPVFTPVPSATSLPLFTAMPTNASVPTATPTLVIAPPTRLPTAMSEYQSQTDAVAEQHYLDDLRDIRTNRTATLNAIDLLMSSAASNVAFMFTSRWQSDVEEGESQLLYYDGAIRALVPPIRFEDLHAAAVREASCTDTYAHHLAALVFDARQEDIDGLVQDSKNLTRQAGECLRATENLNNEADALFD